MAFSVDSREAVDETIRKALAAGGTPSQEVQDYGFMYSHSFQDPDGHLWEVMWMDPAGPAGRIAPAPPAGSRQRRAGRLRSCLPPLADFPATTSTPMPGPSSWAKSPGLELATGPATISWAIRCA